MGYKTPDCPAARRCGGCEWLSVPYPIQLQRKMEHVRSCFDSILDGETIRPIVGMDEPIRFRNKIIVAFRQGRNGSIRYGLYARGSHRLVDRDDCIVEDEVAGPILKTISRLARSFKVKPYDENTGTGFLRYALIRIARGTGQVLVCLVCNGEQLRGSRAFVKELRKAHPCIETVVLNVNTRTTNVVLGDRESVLYGTGWIEEELLGCRFRVSSSSFFQVNPKQTEVLYTTAIELARLSGEETILDAYCGTGTIGLIAARNASLLVGVESNMQAVRDARANARRNKIENARFIAGDAGDFMQEASMDKQRFDVVFMDPPRSGSDERFLEALSALAPKRIVYISCNPQTQARDVAHLIRNGYKPEKLVPVDMFPHSSHVETVLSLSKDVK